MVLLKKDKSLFVGAQVTRREIVYKHHAILYFFIAIPSDVELGSKHLSENNSK